MSHMESGKGISTETDMQLPSRDQQVRVEYWVSPSFPSEGKGPRSLSQIAPLQRQGPRDIPKTFKHQYTYN
jgi:hypothetical protein